MLLNFVKVDRNNNRIVGFKMGHILLEESTSYHTVKDTMDTLNINIDNDSFMDIELEIIIFDKI